MRKPFKSIVIRIAFLLIPIIVIGVLHYLTFDEHRYCTPTRHRHVDGFFGTALLMEGWFFIWLIIMIVELIYRRLRRN